MRPAKPDLFDARRPRAVGPPFLQRVGVPRLPQRHRVEAALDRQAEPVRPERVHLREQPPQHRPADAHGLHRVEHPDRRDRHAVMTVSRPEAARPGGGRVLAVMVVGLLDMAVGGMLGAQQAHPVDHPRQRPDRVGAARIAHQVDPVARLVAPRQERVGAPDLQVDADAGHHLRHVTPAAPLDAGLVVDRMCGRLLQHPVGQADRGLEARLERRQRPVEQHDMRPRRRRVLGPRPVAPPPEAAEPAPEGRATRRQRPRRPAASPRRGPG